MTWRAMKDSWRRWDLWKERIKLELESQSENV